MADRDELADPHRQVFGQMHDAAVLDIGALANLDEIDVAAQHGGGPDARPRGQPHVADHHRLRSHVGRRIDLRLDEKKASTFARGHPASFRDAPVLSSRRSFPEQQSMTVARMPKYQLLE